MMSAVRVYDAVVMTDFGDRNGQGSCVTVVLLLLFVSVKAAFCVLKCVGVLLEATRTLWVHLIRDRPRRLQERVRQYPETRDCRRGRRLQRGAEQRASYQAEEGRR